MNTRLTTNCFVSLAIDWVLSKRHYRFEPFSWSGEADFICTGKNGESFQVGIFEDGRICAIHFISFTKFKKQPVQWTTDFILDTKENILAFQLYAEGDIEHFPRNIPSLIESIISSGYCNDDHNIKVSGDPVAIGDDDANWVAEMVLHKVEYALPIVYLTYDAARPHIVDSYKLAKHLNGTAHIVCECTRSISDKLKKLTNNTSPVDGAIEIIYPGGSKRFSAAELVEAGSYVISQIADVVYSAQIPIEDRFLWDKLQSKKQMLSDSKDRSLKENLAEEKLHSPINTRDMEKVNMGTYIGYVEKKDSPFGPASYFNFKPIAEIKDSSLHILSTTEQAVLLPESEKRNINFKYDWNSPECVRQMDSMFTHGSLILFEFKTSDLDDNIKANGDGERNPTGYKVQVIEMINAGKVRRIDCDGIYYAVRKSEILSNFTNDTIVEIDVPSIREGDKVFVELEGFWAGPYEVGYREYTSSYFIKPQIKENKYTINGYRCDNIALYELTAPGNYWSTPESSWIVLVPKMDAVEAQQDVITDDLLIASFRDSIQDGVTGGGQIWLDDIPSLLEHYDTSVLTGSVLSKEVRKNRMNRLVDILTSERDVDNTLNTVTDFICDLLVKYKESPNVEGWLQELFEAHPQLINQLKESKVISERIDQLEQSLTDLVQQRDALEHEISEKTRVAQFTDQAAIEAKKQTLLDMDDEYKSRSSQLEMVVQSLGIANDIDDLQRRQQYLKEQVKYHEQHKKNLENENQDLQRQFLELTSKEHEKMLGIAFDGFMASKLLNAAAKWEREETEDQQKNLVEQVNAVPAGNKTPEELIDYLCRTIQIIRPTYKRNTIINIVICMTQGFLTVFSGEPGCGKTSICNILAKVLGLDKIADYVDCPADCKDGIKRYVPVSVEKGWTSKRDLIGYFNPLSKTFDRSNRRIYDALHQLNSELQASLFNFPYIIMLDEANLSPMEYYWSDFMNICDDLGPQSKINLGEDYVFGIPKTLHFLATINNDHTTETLSPRLIDRAWIISLPQQHSPILTQKEIPEEKIEIISWSSLEEAFILPDSECKLSNEVQKIYDTILIHLKKQLFVVNYRVDAAIKRYWAVASRHFENDETGTDAAIVALDYAIAQRILPKIIGDGKDFESWLKDFGSLCSNHDLNMSAGIIKSIIERGNQRMNYYQFFA